MKAPQSSAVGTENGDEKLKTPSILEQEKCFGRANGTGVLLEKD